MGCGQRPQRGESPDASRQHREPRHLRAAFSVAAAHSARPLWRDTRPARHRARGLPAGRRRRGSAGPGRTGRRAHPHRRSGARGRRLRARRVPAGYGRRALLQPDQDRRPVRIGSYELAAPLALAPMAGVTDLPFRRLCRSMGAGIAASEMVTSDLRLWNSAKTRHRLDHRGEPEPRVVQIAGYDPAMMADAARMNAELGAQVIDVNFGCPAKKVCNRAAGSALMRDEALVARILSAVVDAAGVPVTLKMRTGWDRDNRNAVAIARIAEGEGIAGLAVHGRTRADFFEGDAEYETVAAVKQSVALPVF